MESKGSFSLVSDSDETTFALGRSLAGFCKAGTVLLLDGELAAGKTVFAKGIGEGLGVREHIKSPTFTLLYPYEGRLPFYHFDVYRLSDGEEFLASGFDEYLGGDGVALIEWAERIADSLEAEYIRIQIDRGANDEKRVLHFSACGVKHQTILETWREYEHLGL